MKTKAETGVLQRASQEMPTIAGNHQKLGDIKQIIPQTLQKEPILPTL